MSGLGDAITRKIEKLDAEKTAEQRLADQAARVKAAQEAKVRLGYGDKPAEPDTSVRD